MHCPPSCSLSLLIPPPPRSTLFPYTTLFRSDHARSAGVKTTDADRLRQEAQGKNLGERFLCARAREIGRARLNSSHGSISYAVFCLKKKRGQAGIEEWRPPESWGWRRGGSDP